MIVGVVDAEHPQRCTSAHAWCSYSPRLVDGQQHIAVAVEESAAGLHGITRCVFSERSDAPLERRIESTIGPRRYELGTDVYTETQLYAERQHGIAYCA
jgi:hypothetical protein